MMFFLVFDVAYYAIRVRLAYREGAVAGLPEEFKVLGALRIATFATPIVAPCFSHRGIRTGRDDYGGVVSAYSDLFFPLHLRFRSSNILRMNLGAQQQAGLLLFFDASPTAS
jgi:hypothetical protein